jgi:hypothetical protein
VALTQPQLLAAVADRAELPKAEAKRVLNALSRSPRGRRSAAPRQTGCVPRAAMPRRAAEGERGQPGARRCLDQRRGDDIELELLTGLGGREQELQLAHRERLFPKWLISGHVKPPLGRLHTPQRQNEEAQLTYE